MRRIVRVVSDVSRRCFVKCWVSESHETKALKRNYEIFNRKKDSTENVCIRSRAVNGSTKIHY